MSKIIKFFRKKLTGGSNAVLLTTEAGVTLTAEDGTQLST